jgi:SAM-dependent methyltransferase
MPQNEDYVLGTNNKESKRLGLQHNVWKPYVLECWQRAGITTGHKVADIGAGPGFATIDLAEMVGETGEIYSIERSSNFTKSIMELSSVRNLKNIKIFELDLIKDDLPEINVDFTWCRWVACFVSDPQKLVQKIGNMLNKGGVSIFFEYGDYSTWRFAPQNIAVKSFVKEVMKSWRNTGGEPDIALILPTFLINSGFRIRSIKPHIFCVRPNEFIWQWPSSFIENNLDRLLESGKVTIEWTMNVRDELKNAEKNPNTYMITPMVLEIVAEKL